MSLLRYEKFKLIRKNSITTNTSGVLTDYTTTTEKIIMGNLQHTLFKTEGLENILQSTGIDISDIAYFYTQYPIQEFDIVEKINLFGYSDRYTVFKLYDYTNFADISANNIQAIVTRVLL